LFKTTPCVHQPDRPPLSFWNSNTLSLLLVGTPFQQDVWKALLKIPEGRTISYLGLAESLGRPSATRAVAHAVSRNPITLVVPCHRVIQKNGGLGGFRMGKALKKRLLEEERNEQRSKACA